MYVVVQTNTNTIPLTNVFTALADEYLDNGKSIGFASSGIPTWYSGYYGKLLFESITERLYVGISGGWRLVPDAQYINAVSGSLRSDIISSGDIMTVIANVSGAVVITSSGITNNLINTYSGYVDSTYATKVVLNSASGTLDTKIDNTSGTLNNKIWNSGSIVTYIDNVSGVLNSKIWSSGSIVTAIADASGGAVAVSTTNLNNVSGVLRNDIWSSGSIVTAIANASGAAVITASGAARGGHEAAYNHTNYDTAFSWSDWHAPLGNASGTLNTKIDNVSGSLASQISSSGSEYIRSDGTKLMSGLFSFANYALGGIHLSSIGNNVSTHKTLVNYDAASDVGIFGNLVSINAGDTILSSFWGVDVVLDNGGYAYAEGDAPQCRIAQKVAFNVSRKSASGVVGSLFTVLGRTGNVGIGTTNPLTKFHAVIPYSKTDTTERTLCYFTSNDASGAAGLYLSLNGHALYQSSRMVKLQTTESNIVNAGNLCLQPEAGNVGIGLNSIPPNKLTIQDSTNDCTVSIAAAAANKASYLTLATHHDNYGAYSLWKYGESYPKWALGAWNHDIANINFITWSGSNNYQRMVITQAGAVGINQSSPQTWFHTSVSYAKTDTSEHNVAMFTSNETTDAAGLRILLQGAASQASRIAILQTTENNVVNDGTVSLQPSGGKVGVKTTTPFSDFDVSGNICLSEPSGLIYLGNPATDGTIRFGNAGGAFIIQKKISGVWASGFAVTW